MTHTEMQPTCNRHKTAAMAGTNKRISSATVENRQSLSNTYATLGTIKFVLFNHKLAIAGLHK